MARSSRLRPTPARLNDSTAAETMLRTGCRGGEETGATIASRLTMANDGAKAETAAKGGAARQLDRGRDAAAGGLTPRRRRQACQDSRRLAMARRPRPRPMATQRFDGSGEDAAGRLPRRPWRGWRGRSQWQTMAHRPRLIPTTARLSDSTAAATMPLAGCRGGGGDKHAETCDHRRWRTGRSCCRGRRSSANLQPQAGCYRLAATGRRQAPHLPIGEGKRHRTR